MDGYQPSLNPGVQTDYGGAPGDWGGGLTRGLEEAGASMDDAIHQIKQRNRDIQATDAGVQFAADSAKLDQQSIDLRNQAGPGGDGHSFNVNTAINQTSEQSLGQIRDPHIRQIFQERYAQLGDQLSTREYAWQAGKAVDKIATDYGTQGDTWASSAAATGDPHVMVNAASSLYSTAHSLSGINDDLKDKLYREEMNKVALSWGDAAARLNPTQLIGDQATGAKGILDNPEFQSYLHDPKQIDLLRNKAEAELARRAAAAKEQKSQALEANKSAISTLEYKVSNLGYVPTVAETQGLIADAKALGNEEGGLKVDAVQDRAGINQSHQTATPAQWHSEINALQQKVTDGKASPAEQMHLKNLVDLSGPSIAKFNDDPHTWAANTTNPAPAIDWSSADPAQLRQMGAARTAWAGPFAASTGLVEAPYLNKDEQKLFGDGLKAGPESQIQTIQRLQMTFGSAVTAQIAHQLMPGDKHLEVMAGLNDRGQALYLRGVTAQQSKIVHLGAESGTDAADDRKRIDDTLAWYSDAIPSDLLPAVRDAALNIAAGTAMDNRHFNPTGDELQNVVRQAVQRVAGLQGDPAKGENVVGGFANLGKRFGRTDGDDNHVWLPQDMGRGELQRRISSAQAADWTKAGGGPPYYVGNDGKPAPLSAVQMRQLRNYRFAPARDPRTGAFAPGNFNLLDANGHSLMQKDGRTPWQFNIRNLAK